jgi:nitroreductase
MPPRAVIDRAFRIAILAPNHYRTNPWRFFAFAAQRRAPLAAAYERAAARLGRDVARARQRALDAPLMIVVGCIPSTATPRVKAAEETFATAAAIQNLLLAFAAAGVATLITTGDLALSQEVNDLVRLPEQGGSVMAVVNAGYIDPAGRVAPRPELELDQFVSWFDGSETASPPA